MDPIIVYPAMIIVPLSILYLGVTSPKKRLDIEKNETPIFEEMCGAKINFINYSWPFVRHSVYKKFIVIKCLGNALMLPRDTLSFEVDDGVVSKGIRYKSPEKEWSNIRIWTNSKEKVLNELSGKA